ncbi:MAG: ATP-binding cassette domain-containing protein, partial [Clostridia bacterium]
VEVDRGSLSFYETNYRGYVEQKAERMQVEAGMRRKLSSLLRKEMDWMHQGAKARGTKSRYRIERVATMEENLESGTTQGKLTMDAASSRLGRKTLAMRTVSKAYGEQTVIHSFSMQLLRDDRIGIVGANGCGKTTLLRLIEGTLAPDTGEVERGETVRMGVFRQEADELDPALRVIDAVQEIAPHVQTKEGVLTASQMLENFLFPGTMQYAKVGKLSGGEKRRLMLLRVLMSAPNVLLLDEPTNDLDIDTLTVLEDYLASFPGAVVAVSHDRYFLDKVAERVFAFSGHGEIREYVGGYRDWREAVETAPPCEETRRVEPTVRRTLPRKLKFTYQEEREFAQIEQLIADAEAQLEALDVQAQAAASDYLQLQALDAQKAAKEAELEEKMARWVYLTEKQEAIARQE